MEVKQQGDILILIVRNLAETADRNEIMQLQEWIEHSDNNRIYYEQVRNIWDSSDKLIDRDTIDPHKALEKVLKRLPKGSTKRILFKYWQKVASFIILPFAIGTLLWIYFHSYKINSTDAPLVNEVYASFGTRSSMKLSDGTIVWLNSGSSLIYPDKFKKSDRIVHLKGEGYFEVKSDISRPFIVKTSTLEVKATGTKFNVMDYDQNPVSEVTLVSGKVFVSKSGADSQLITELNPNQHLDFIKETNQKSISEEDTYKFIAWKDGKLIFRNEPLSEVARKIGQAFNVEIEIQGDKLNNYRYRATFQDESLEEILKLLKYTAPIDFKEIKRDPFPDGSFPKKKVIIFPMK